MAKIEDLKSSVNIVDIVGAFLQTGLKKKSADTWEGLCYFHAEKTPSFKVFERKQRYKCFGCGASGDVLDFLEGTGLTFQEAKDFLAGKAGNLEFKPAALYIPDENRPVWTPVPPDQMPADAPKPKFEHHELGPPSKIWAYRDRQGRILGYIIRYELGGNKKEMRPMTYCTDGTRFAWRWKSFGIPRPLYNLDLFTKKPNHQNVLIVEGEKAADAANYFFEGKIICTTWPHGAESIKIVDWSPLQGKNVYLWPDNDKTQKYGKTHPLAGQVKPFEEQPGNEAMLTIYEQIKGIAKSVKWVNNSDSFPDKWDIADASGVWTEADAQKYLKENTGPVPLKGNNPPPPSTKKRERKKEYTPYKILGFEKQDSGPHKYHFYSYANNTAVALRPDQMKEVNLTTIAPLNYWAMKFADGKKIDLKALVDSLTSEAHRVGVISFDDYRGRGAWIDQGRVVVHAGDHLVVDGKKMAFQDLDTHNIYEQSRLLNIDLTHKADTASASKLIDLCKSLNWERTANAYLLAGWIVISPVCGVLPWRPHIWVTGPSGGGKTTIMHEIVKALIKNVAVTFQASTTEAGIRQRLKYDAVPVLFDEADVDDRQDAQRIQQILGFIRANSSSEGGEIAKGTSAGTGKTYVTKSCFALSSINTQVSATQDRSRITLLGLKENENNPEKFKALLLQIHNLINDDFAKQLQARTIHNLRTILHNSKIFSQAAAVILGRQRSGDQIGPLLAGAYSLENEGQISLEDAINYISRESFDWTEEKGLESIKDELLLLQHIMEQVVFLENADGIGKIERNIGEMIKVAVGHTAVDVELSSVKSEDRLRRLGIKVDGNYITFSNTSIHLKKMLEGTGWAKNHNKVLMRLEGAVSIESTSFTTDLRTRAVKVPLGYITTAPVTLPKTESQLRKEQAEKDILDAKNKGNKETPPPPTTEIPPDKNWPPDGQGDVPF